MVARLHHYVGYIRKMSIFDINKSCGIPKPRSFSQPWNKCYCWDKELKWATFWIYWVSESYSWTLFKKRSEELLPSFKLHIFTMLYIFWQCHSTDQTRYFWMHTLSQRFSFWASLWPFPVREILDVFTSTIPILPLKLQIFHSVVNLSFLYFMVSELSVLHSSHGIRYSWSIRNALYCSRRGRLTGQRPLHPNRFSSLEWLRRRRAEPAVVVVQEGRGPPQDSPPLARPPSSWR